MTSTICTTLEPSFSRVMDYARNSNTASFPLPSIPRRTSASRKASAHSISEPSLPSITGMTATSAVHPSTPPLPVTFGTTSWRDKAASLQSDSSPSSTSSEDSHPTINLRSKRVHGQRSPMKVSTEQYSLPVPATRSKPKAKPCSVEPRVRGQTIELSLGQMGPPDNMNPPSPPSTNENQLSNRKSVNLGMNLESFPTRHVSESHVPTLVMSHSPPVLPTTASIIFPSEGRLLRKKSGEPIKSSLKSVKPPGLSVTIKPSSSKSEPTTPSQFKAVHFDAKLEHVKLFLPEQKPLAVSRDGSPTDTSGTDTDFPEFIFGHSSDEETTRKKLVMQVTNMPKGRRADADVALQELTLSQDSTSIHGRVKVKNVAFEKRLAVRFTFDWWQTTSEVTAKYIESLKDNTSDIFGFTIRLNDIMAHIDGKTLFLALRYTVAGKEIWDNNGGQNYLAKFSKRTGPPPQVTPNGKDAFTGSAMTHLNSQLEEVAQGREPGASFLAQRIHRQAISDAEQRPSIQNDNSLSARYDFSASLKDNSWKAASPTPSAHFRSNTDPSPSNTIPWPKKASPQPHHIPPRSPRTSALGFHGVDVVGRTPASAIDDEPSYSFPRRNHQRGYTDKSMPETSGIKMTPPETPRTLRSGDSKASALSTLPSQLSGSHSFLPGDSSRKSPLDGAAAFESTWTGWQHSFSGESENSTPPNSSPSSSPTKSPSLSPTEEFKRVAFGHEHSLQSPRSHKGNDNYRSFLNRFCFYTGAGTEHPLNAPVDEFPRCHSASSIEFFQSPPTAFSPNYSPFSSPTHRSSSFDELAYRSGSSTPTAVALSLPSPVHPRAS